MANIVLLSVGAGFLLCQLVAFAATSQLGGAKISRNELRRIARTEPLSPAAAVERQTQSSVAPGGTKTKAKVAARKNKQTERKGQRLISRRSSIAGEQFAPESDNAATARTDDHSPYSDTWNPHSLVPTFTDQEQGDEMVALASDQQGGAAELAEQRQVKYAHSELEGRKAVAGANRTSLKESARLELAASGGGELQRTRAHLQDEYYHDEDDQDEDEPHAKAAGLAGGGRALQPAAADKQSDAQSYAALFNQHEFGFRPIGAGDSANRSQLELNQGQSENFGRDAPGNNGNQQQQQVRPPGMADKLINLFSKGDSLSKTDAAIEYLKGLLKSKQQANNLTEAQFHKQQAEQNQPSQATKFFSQLPMRIVSHSNVTQTFFAPATSNESAPVQPTTATTAAKASDEPATVDYSLHLAQVTAGPGQLQVERQASRQQALAAAPNFERQQTAGAAKFSISDAKQPPKPLNVHQQRQSTLSSPQTGALFREDELPSLASRNFEAKNEQLAQPEVAGHIAPPNGTPLGGDFVESIDDFRRPWQAQPPPPPPPRHSEAATLDRMQNSVERRNKSLELDQVETLASEQQPLKFQAQVHRQVAAGEQKGAKSSRFFQMPVGGSAELISYAPTQQQQALPEIAPAQLAELKSVSKGQQGDGTQPLGLFDAEQHIAARVREQEAKFLDGAANARQHVEAFRFASNKTDAAEERENLGQQQQQEGQQAERSPIGKMASAGQQPQASKQQQVAYSTQSGPAKFAGQTVEFFNQFGDEQAKQQQLKSSSATKLPAVQSRHAEALRAQFQQQPPQPQVESQANDQVGGEQLPKIVSYNYFESPANEPQSPAQASGGELLATNYALSDALYSSTGRVEQVLSRTDLDAIRSQFSTAEHPTVPLGGQGDSRQAGGFQQQAALAPQVLQQLNGSPAKYAEEVLKELASEEQKSTAAAGAQSRQPLEQLDTQSSESAPINLDAFSSEPKDPNKKKSLIVYLNHPRQSEIEPAKSADDKTDTCGGGGDEATLAQLVGEQNSGNEFVTAKEFDSHGLSKSSKQLDVANLKDFSSQTAKDKDGLSVVVIGDAYKYKKIVLLISSKSGGLKFIPMVKDMKK